MRKEASSTPLPTLLIISPNLFADSRVRRTHLYPTVPTVQALPVCIHFQTYACALLCSYHLGLVSLTPVQSAPYRFMARRLKPSQAPTPPRCFNKVPSQGLFHGQLRTLTFSACDCVCAFLLFSARSFLRVAFEPCALFVESLSSCLCLIVPTNFAIIDRTRKD